MFSPHSHAAKIARITGVRRRNHPGKRNWKRFPACEPPMAAIEIWNSGAVEERKLMELRQRLHRLLVLPIDLANPVRAHLRHRFACSISLSGIPLARAQDSTAAAPYCATAFFTAQHGMTRGVGKVSKSARTTMTKIIFRAPP